MRKIYFSLILTFFCFFICFNSVSANSSLRRVTRLNEETLTKGYTLSNDQFSVGIQPETFSDPAKIYLRPVNVDNKNIDLPDDLNLISQVFLYDVQVPEQTVLNKVIWLSLEYDSDSKYQKDLYFYNGVTEKWQKLLCTQDKYNNLIKSGWWFPYSIVAVFENPNEIEGPTKASNFSSFSDPLDAAAAIVIDEDTGKVLYKKNENKQRSIASLTKIMTALVFLDTETSMDKVITYDSKNNREGARLRVDHGETMTVEDIFYCMLVGSGNNCAITLAESTGLSQKQFISRMNSKAQELGLNNTTFADPSGLEVKNKSTASDYARLIQVALDEAEILTASTTKLYEFYTLNTNEYHGIKNTNLLLNWGLYTTGGKTGYLDEALYCLTYKAKQNDHEVITVLLGNPSSYDRFSETYDLTKWALDNYTW